VPSFLTWKVDSWILATRDGHVLAHAADLGHALVTRVTVVSVGYLTLLLRPHLPSPRPFISHYPFQTVLSYPQPFLLASFLPVNITTLSRLMPPIMSSPEQTPYNIRPRYDRKELLAPSYGSLLYHDVAKDSVCVMVICYY
jgi:hypothetical protein